MIDNIAIGKTIARLRQSKNMTQQQLAAALSVSHQAVSKWENGAALPDVQTLMALTRLFGVTMEQLLTGDVPEDRLESKSPLEEPLRDIGNFVNNIVTGIFGGQKSPEGEVPEAEQTEEPAEAEPEEASAPEPEAPVAEAEPATDDAGAGETFDLKHLLQMAPFMSKAALDALLLEHKGELTAAEIAKFAPFISRDCLEKLIQNPQTEITWETLSRIAPFLKREMVDRLTKAAAESGKFVRQAADQGCKTGDDIGKALGDVSQKIGEGVTDAIKKVGKLGEDVAGGVTSAIEELVDGLKGKEERNRALRRAAFARALQDDKWDWIAQHIDELDDEELLKDIAQKANNQGMHDWVLEHMNGYADTRTIDAAIEAGNWGWLGDHVWQFEDELQEKIALAAAKAENWLWLETYAGQISLDTCADQIGIAAYKAEARVLALQIAEKCMKWDQREALANAAVAVEDYDFLEKLAPQLNAEYFGRLCLARAQGGQWDCVSRFAPSADRKSLEHIMEIAIAEGNFDAIDMIYEHLK